MNQKEQARLSALNSELEYQVPIAEAAELLDVSPRHARRLLAGYRKHGAAALDHDNRGRRPHNATLPAEAAAVVQLATDATRVPTTPTSPSCSVSEKAST